jgi:hypothetical protein
MPHLRFVLIFKDIANIKARLQTTPSIKKEKSVELPLIQDLYQKIIQLK